MRKMSAVASVLTVVAMLAACGSGQPSADSDPSGSEQASGTPAVSGGNGEPMRLTIGSIHAQTGDLGTYGPPMNRAAEMAIDVANEAAEEADLGLTVDFAAEDSESRAEGAVAAARKVIADGASCILGPLTTPEAVAVLNAATKQREMTMIPEASAAALRDTDDAGTIFRVIPPDTRQGQALAIAVEKQLGGAEGKKVAFAYQNSSYGEGLLESFSEAWEEIGGTVDVAVGYAAAQPSYDSEAQKLTAEEMDAIIVADFPETFGKLSDALLRTGKYDPERLFVADALAVSPIPDAISPEALEGARGTQGGAVADSPQSDAFSELSDEVLGSDQRGSFDALVFDAVMLCILAAAAADSTEPSAITAEMPNVANPPGTEFTYLELADAIEALRSGEDIDYVGVSSDIEFGEDGDTTSARFEQFRFVDGELTVEETIEIE